LVNHARGAASLPHFGARFVALEFILRKTRSRMVNAWFASLLAHDLFRKPVPTFRDHALAAATQR